MDEGPSCYLTSLVLLNSISFSFILFSIVLVAILLLLSALISGSEVAFFSLTADEIKEYKDSKSKKERQLAKLLAKPKKLLATVLICNNLINVAIVTYSTYAANRIFSSVSAAIIALSLTLFTTVFITFFGELIPKVYASHNNVKFALFNIRLLSFADKFFSWLSIPLMSLTNVVDNRIKKKEYELSVSDLETMVELTSEANEASEEEKEMLKGIVNFGTINVKQIMRVRTDITAFDHQMNFHELMDKINKSGYSRIPVYRDTVDYIVGILYVKDLLPYIENEENFRWQSLLRKTYFIPETKKIDALLKSFKERRVHMAIVVDEYGGTSGLITLEDVLEEIVGEINDEFDDEDIDYTQVDKETYVFDAKTSLNDFCKITGIQQRSFEEVKGESESLGGLLLELHSSMPNVGEEISYERFLFIVESVNNKRIKRIRVRIDAEKAAETE